ncbi:MAG: hypothetical protein RIS90_2622 [Pseudomonadota bacterium]|jgi:prepilin peptidase CpaA
MTTPPSEFQAMLELLALLVFNWRNGVLLALLLLAGVIDYRTHRIPNLLVLCGLAFGLVYNGFNPPVPGATPFWGLAGAGLGLLALLPLYALGIMGAGDVKLMAMVGAFVGPAPLLHVLLYTLMSGGLLALALVLARGRARQVWRNLGGLMQLAVQDSIAGRRPSLRLDAGASAGKLPYALAIGMGAVCQLLLQPMGLLRPLTGQ